MHYCSYKSKKKKKKETYWNTLLHNLSFLRDILKSTIFNSEIPPFFLCDIINVCLEYEKQNSLNAEEIKAIIEILTTLSTCNRFNLAINFMADHEKENCSQLLKYLEDKVKSEDITVEKNAITSLIQKYQII